MKNPPNQANLIASNDTCTPEPDLGKILQAIIDVVFVINEQGTFQFVSPACMQLFGYTAKEMTGVHFSNFIHPEDIARTAQVFTTRTPNAKTSSLKNRCFHKDGAVIPTIWSARWDEKDRLFYCVARDGSEKYELEQTLQKAQEIARLGNFQYDTAGKKFTQVSDMFYRICGLDKNTYPEIPITLFLELIHPNDREYVQQLFSQYNIETDKKLDYRLIRPDGMVVYISHHRKLQFDLLGKHQKTVCAIQDITDRKISELAIQQSKERLNALVQNSHDLLGIIDKEGIYTFVGENIKDQLSYNPEDLLGKSAFQFIHPDDAGGIADALVNVQMHKTIRVGPFRFLNGKGEWRWMETVATSHLDNPSLDGIVVNSRDITEKKSQEDDLNKLSLVAQEAKNPILITDLDNKITWANNAFYQLSEYNASEVLGRYPKEIFSLDEYDSASKAAIYTELLAGRSVRSESRYHSKSGKEYWLDLTIQAVYGADNKIIYHLAVGQDTTERKLAEMARLEMEQRYQALVKHGSDLIVILDHNSAFTYVSENVKTVLGYTATELQGKCAFDYIHPEDVDIVGKRMISVLNNDTETKGIQHRFLHRDGSWVWLESKGYDHHNHSSIEGMLINARDITDRMHLQEMLNSELLNKQKEITAAVIKAQEAERSQLGLELHDNVNQILATAKLYNELYLSGHIQGKELLAKSAQYTKDAINEIRSISRRLSAPTLGKISLKDSITELVNSINLTRYVEIKFKSENIDDFEASQDLHLAIYRIVQEGINNIIKYSQATTACIEMYLNSTELCVNIVDNGKGFDPEIKKDGIGILNMLTRAENMNGTFELKSAPGEGCQIKTTFPIKVQ